MTAEIAELGGVEPALVEIRDAHQIRAKRQRHALDLGRRIFRRSKRLAHAGNILEERELIVEALAPVFGHLEIGEDVADVPRRVVQRVILLREALRRAEVLQRVAVSLIKALTLGAADALVPP